MEKEQKSAEEKLRDRALEYLNKTYEDSFEPESYELGGWAYDWDTVRFIPKKYPEALVEVRVYRKEDGSYYFEDDYYNCYMYEEALEYYKDVFTKDVPVAVKMRFGGFILSDRLNGAKSFKEWRKVGEPCYAEVYYFTSVELTEDEQTNIVERIAGDKVAGRVTFFITNDENLLVERELEDIINYQEELTEMKTVFSIDYDYKIEME